MDTTAMMYGPQLAAAPAAVPRRGSHSATRIATILGAVFVEAFLIVGVVTVSLGIGTEGQGGPGEVWPTPAPPALALPPDPLSQPLPAEQPAAGHDPGARSTVEVTR